MTPQESREAFADSVFTHEEITKLIEQNLYNDYIFGLRPIEELYAAVRDQGV